MQGKSALPMEVLSEVLEETRQRVLDTSRRVTELTLELENESSRVAEMQAEFDRIFCPKPNWKASAGGLKINSS